ncbi:pentapeptide repeat-containing protein [Prauserella cavernicola]|uniref:Pentapeptide repeat-containing protein n=1 Tax=Prauserella cavernicola TaxID=2800127 RepID=A0A934QPR7_9PSEU|nr:pentapeptide repeat-containing protein [Prauserella cavernicola]MBK1783484.1 pentapeptide repeat-containing protein [Prauserella cavernicola]
MTTPRALTDLPFHRYLEDTDEVPGPSSDHEVAHYRGTDFSDVRADGARLTECAFSDTTFGASRWRGARFNDVWFQGSQLVGTDLAESQWLDTEFVTCALAGTATFDVTMNRVVFHGCKLVSVNLREARLDDVTFSHCVLRDVDFAGAGLRRVSFPGSELLGVHLDQAVMDGVDVRGAGELDLRTGRGSLKGLTITHAQLAELAPLFAAALEITVTD